MNQSASILDSVNTHELEVLPVDLTEDQLAMISGGQAVVNSV